MTIQHHASQSTSLNMYIPAHWDERLYSLYGSPNEQSSQSQTLSPSKVDQPQQKTSTLVQEMYTIWCEETGEVPTTLPSYLGQRLLTFLKTEMYGSTDRWRTYCCKITSSKFLMGEIEGCDFKAQLSWVINQVNFNKIESGKFTLGDRENRKIELSDIEQQIQLIIAAQPTTEIQALHRYLKQELGAFKYFHWFREMHIIIENDQIIRLKFAKRFYISWIKSHCEFALSAAIKAIYPSFKTYEMYV